MVWLEYRGSWNSLYMWGELKLPPYIEGVTGGTVGNDFPYSSPDMGWGRDRGTVGGRLIEPWAPHGSRLNSVWVPRGSRLNSAWVPRGSHLNSMCDPHKQCVGPTWGHDSRNRSDSWSFSIVYILVGLARYARLYQKHWLKILMERYYSLLCSKQHRIDVLS